MADLLASMRDGDYAAELTARGDGDVELAVVQLEGEAWVPTPRFETVTERWHTARPDLHPYLTATHWSTDGEGDVIGAIAGLAPPRINRVALQIGEVTRTVPLAPGGAFVALLRGHHPLRFRLKFLTEKVVVLEEFEFEADA